MTTPIIRFGDDVDLDGFFTIMDRLDETVFEFVMDDGKSYIGTYEGAEDDEMWISLWNREAEIGSPTEIIAVNALELKEVVYL